MQNAECRMQNEKMKSDNVILVKSMEFSVRIVNLYKYLSKEKKETVMSKQLLRCGTSIGANAYEGSNAQSKSDFVSKMYIALKEATETEYWITLLSRTGYLTVSEFESIFADCVELKKILTSILKTSKQQKT